MAPWQRRARLGFGLFAATFAVMLWFVLGERRTAAPPLPTPRLDPNAVSEIRGGDVVQVKGAKRDIRIEFATQVLYQDGSAHYRGFKAVIDDRGGRSFEITGVEARVAPEQSAIDVKGDVNVRTSDGLVAKTDHATFAEADGVLRGDGPISFARGRTKGSGVGFTYERAIDRLQLLDRAAIDVAPTEREGGMSVRAGSAAYSRSERFFRFERQMRMERGAQIIEALTATAFLLPDRDEPKTVELRGNSSIHGATPTSTLRQMTAQDINLTYADDGRTLQHVFLAGQSRLEIAKAAGAGTAQELTAATIDITLAPDGAVTQLLARDNTRVTIPPAENVSAREITAQGLTASGKSGQSLNDMLFENNVVYKEDVPGANPRLVRARALHARLSDAGTIDTANFTGGFAFEHGALRADSAEAAYNVSKGTLNLRGGQAARPPSIRNEGVDLRRANTIDVALSPLNITARGSVLAVFAPGRQEGERGTTMFQADEAITVVCETLTFDEATGAGTYTGSPARVFQDSGNQIRGDVITMNEKSGRLTARGSVVTSLPLAATGSGAKGNSTGRAAEFEFDDAKRSVTFSGDAQLDGSQGNLNANRIELRLADTGNEVQQLTARGSVVVFVDDRKASGESLVYHPSDASYVLNGAPVRLMKGCQESAGRTLKFYRDSENVVIDGHESRVQTKGGKCPESPSRR